MALIEVEALTIRYVGRKTPTLHELSLTLHAGETVLLLGPSGCGKSTLALTLNGLIPHSLAAQVQGHVRIVDQDTQLHSVAELAQQVGVLFQDPEAQFVTLTVEDEILFGLENLRFPPEAMPARVTTALAQVGMTAQRRQPVDRLSGGQKQRIALAALLAMEPQILVFDEPTANLDPAGTQEVFRLLAELKARKQHTIILIEHKLDELIHLIDRVVVLGEQGRILADGSPLQVFRDHADTVQAAGVWMPEVCRLAQQLRQRSISLTPFPLTVDEAEIALRALPSSLPIRRTMEPPAAPAAAIGLEVRQLSFRYGQQPILHELSLQVPQGDFLAIVGANGAGKTTLAQHLVGILPTPPGTVFVGEQDISRLPARALTKHIGYVFQNPEHQFITNSVAEEIAYGLRTMQLDSATIAARTEALLDRFGLSPYARANPFTLSHGEKRRLSVATMLAMGQQTLILDEPTFGQDQHNATEILQLLRDLHAEGRTIIVITHDMALVADYAQHVAVLAAGRLLFHGPTPALFAQPDLLAAARLRPPPIAQLAARLAEQAPQWAGVLSMRQLL